MTLAEAVTAHEATWQAALHTGGAAITSRRYRRRSVETVGTAARHQSVIRSPMHGTGWCGLRLTAMRATCSRTAMHGGRRHEQQARTQGPALLPAQTVGEDPDKPSQLP